MVLRRFSHTVTRLGFGLALGLGFAGVAHAQHTPDPYNIVGEYNNQYEPYMYATYPTERGTLPNQNRLEPRSGVRNANSFQRFMEEEEGDGPAIDASDARRRSSRPGVPYYQAYRRLDESMNRTYKANSSAADENFYLKQKQRDKKYFEALREQDPRKRAQMLRDYAFENMRNVRDKSESSSARPERDLAPGDRKTLSERSRGRTSTSLADDDEAMDDEMTSPESSRRSRSTSPSSPSRRENSGHAPDRPMPSARGPVRNNPTSRAPARSGVPSGTGRAPVNSRSGASDILKRSDLMDRARRETAPALPRSTAPEPR